MLTNSIEQPEQDAAACRPSLRERQREARDEAILEATFALFVEKGFDSVTMDDVAERVAISRQTLYHHFRSKDDLVLRAVLSLMEQGIVSIQSIDPALPPIERIAQVLRWMIDHKVSPAIVAICKVQPALIPIKAHPEYKRIFDRRTQVIREIVEAGQADGTITRDLPSLAIVQSLLALTSGVRYDELTDLSGQSHAELAERIVAMYLRGIRA